MRNYMIEFNAHMSMSFHPLKNSLTLCNSGWHPMLWPNANACRLIETAWCGTVPNWGSGDCWTYLSISVLLEHTKLSTVLLSTNFSGTHLSLPRRSPEESLGALREMIPSGGRIRRVPLDLRSWIASWLVSCPWKYLYQQSRKCECKWLLSCAPSYCCYIYAYEAVLGLPTWTLFWDFFAPSSPWYSLSPERYVGALGCKRSR